MERLKLTVIRGMERVGTHIPPVLADVLFRAATRIPQLIHLVPPGRDFLYSGYLGRYKVFVDTTYPIEKGMLRSRYEGEFLEWIREHVPAGATALDVGANVGAISFALADKVGAAGRVFAFEPAETMYRRLVANCSMNPGFQGILFPVRLGIADREGELDYYEYGHNRGDGGLSPPDGTWSYHVTHKVEVTTVDRFVSGQGIAKVDFMKVDVEGMEYQVLTGAIGTIRRFLPVMYLETLRSSGRENFSRIRDLLAPLGYGFFRLERRLVHSPVDATNHGDNTLCLPEGCDWTF